MEGFLPFSKITQGGKKINPLLAPGELLKNLWEEMESYCLHPCPMQNNLFPPP